MNHHAASRPMPSLGRWARTLGLALVVALTPLRIHAETCSGPAGSPCTGDGNPCTTDACDGNGTCAHTNNSEPCTDGFFCNGPETCRGGTCSVHAGNPCAGAGECANRCDEAAETCFSPAGTPCTGDGDDCTADHCDGTGRCAHPAKDGTVCSDSIDGTTADRAGVVRAWSD